MYEGRSGGSILAYFDVTGNKEEQRRGILYYATGEWLQNQSRFIVIAIRGSKTL